MTRFTEKELVAFGQYLLSAERTKRIKNDTRPGESATQRLREVYDADLQNWLATNPRKKKK